MKVKYCPYCGEENFVHAIFCCICGKRFNTESISHKETAVTTFFALKEQELEMLTPIKKHDSKPSPLNDFDIIIENNGWILKKYRGKSTNVIIPEGCKGIGDSAFYDCDYLTSITIPKGVTYLGNWAFRGCISLSNVQLPAGLFIIGHYAFNGCTALTRISFPKSLSIIEKSAFFECRAISSISIPKNLRKIGSWAFANCTSLKKIYIPQNVTNIGSFAFKGCNNLTIICQENSYAERYAITNSINVETIK